MTAQRKGELDSAAELPPGPYAVGLTHWIGADQVSHQGTPYTVVCGTGQAIAGHVPSIMIAEAIADALNRRGLG